MAVSDFIVTNCDNAEIKSLKKENNFEKGLIKILEGLSFYIEDLEDFYEEEGDLPYEKLYNSLKILIDTAIESEKIRSGLLTGIVMPKSRDKSKDTSNFCHLGTLEEIREFAKTHTRVQIMKEFKFVSQLSFYRFMSKNKIDYIRTRYVRYDENEIRNLAKEYTLAALAKFLSMDCSNLQKYLKKHNISYKTKKGIVYAEKNS